LPAQEGLDDAHAAAAAGTRMVIAALRERGVPVSIELYKLARVLH
jgi:hypothetical protein